MPNTIGFHVVKSGYGLWLPGDDRGHWSTDWDTQIGYVEPHTLHEARNSWMVAATEADIPILVDEQTPKFMIESDATIVAPLVSRTCSSGDARQAKRGAIEPPLTGT